MDIGYQKLLPVSRKCAHDSIVWDILSATTTETRVKVTCLGCSISVTKTIKLV